MKKYLLVFFCFLNLSYASNPSMDEANNLINARYPSTRWATSAYSLIFGSMAVWKGTYELSLDKPKSHDTLGILMTAAGAARIIDGSIGVFRPYEAERLARDNQIQDSETLERLARSGFYSRMARSSLIMLNSITFLGLYSKGDTEYKQFIYPGGFMAIISIANMINLTPEERAYKKWKKNTSVTFDWVPMQKGGMGLASFSF